MSKVKNNDELVTKKTGENKSKTNELKYTKKQIVLSEKYVNRKDILNVLLKEECSYTFKEVDELLNKFLERKVV